MEHQFTRIRYEKLDSRQKEAFNLQKVGGVLADFGFITIPLSSDWGGADFIAQHCDGKTFLRVQLKGRLTFDKKYLGKGVHVCFRHNSKWFIYPHDEVLSLFFDEGLISQTKKSWGVDGGYSYRIPPKKALSLLEKFRVPA